MFTALSEKDDELDNFSPEHTLDSDDEPNAAKSSMSSSASPAVVSRKNLVKTTGFGRVEKSSIGIRVGLSRKAPLKQLHKPRNIS